MRNCLPLHEMAQETSNHLNIEWHIFRKSPCARATHQPFQISYSPSYLPTAVTTTTFRGLQQSVKTPCFKMRLNSTSALHVSEVSRAQQSPGLFLQKSVQYPVHDRLSCLVRIKLTLKLNRLYFYWEGIPTMRLHVMVACSVGRQDITFWILGAETTASRPVMSPHRALQRKDNNQPSLSSCIMWGQSKVWMSKPHKYNRP